MWVTKHSPACAAKKEKECTLMMLVPESFFLTHGIGVHREQLTAFELALRDADIEQQNLVSISSILPPGCVELERAKGVGTLQPGAAVCIPASVWRAQQTPQCTATSPSTTATA
jgi:pyruvoyl-dependent arginine decarboxylase